MILALIALVVGYAGGYAAAHWRPLHRLDNWAWDQVDRRGRAVRDGAAPARRPARWWAAQAVFAAEIAGVFLVHPRRTSQQWRHRHDPPARAEPVKFNPQWRDAR